MYRYVELISLKDNAETVGAVLAPGVRGLCADYAEGCERLAKMLTIEEVEDGGN